MTARTTIAFGLIGIGIGAIVAVFATNDEVWQSIWVGLASTTIIAGVVDLIGLLERRRQEQVVLDIAGQRVGRLHQRLLWLLVAVFGLDGEARDMPAALRTLDDWSYDPSAPANVFPPRTQEVWISQCLAELDEAFDVALALGIGTREVDRFSRLDTTLRSGAFMSWIRSGASQSVRNAEVLSQDAADVLSSVQHEFQFFAARGRPGWKFGSLEA